MFITFNDKVKTNFDTFKIQISKMIVIATKGNYNDKDAPQYLREFATFYDTWLMNKYIGGGVKNFRYYCHTRPNLKKIQILFVICIRTITI